MLELTSNQQPVHLSPGTSVQLELNSPLFDEDVIKGSFSYAFSVPAPLNGPLYGFPERPDGALAPGAALPAELSLAGLPLLTGSQRVKSASVAKYSVSVQGGLSGVALSARLLSSFAYGGLREVPRWVQQGSLAVPGLPLHANQVLAAPAAYPYVFAPLRNEYLSDETQALLKAAGVTLNPLDYPPETINQWQLTAFPVLGIPAGGSFTYNVNFQVPGGVQLSTYRLLPPYCPFPRLRYVLQAIFEESGLLVDVAQLLPGELGELVIVGNALLVDRGDATTLRFSLADVLPALTVAELLAALRRDLGIVVYLDAATQQVRTGYLVERVAASATYVDLSERLAGYPEVTIEDTKGLTLTYRVDEADELTKDQLDKQPDPTLVLPAVATLADLPLVATLLTDNPQNGQVRLVLDLDVYYACTLSYLNGVQVTLSWQEWAVNLAHILVAGGGEEQAQAMCYTRELPTRLLGTGSPLVLAPVPALSQPPFLAGQAQQERSAALRLLFYNGLQLASDGVSAYPQLSHRSASGSDSLRLTGAQGTYARWLAAWLPLKLSGASYKQPLLLTALDLARLDLTRPVRLDGVPYLVRKLSATVPLRKAAVAELVRL